MYLNYIETTQTQNKTEQANKTVFNIKTLGASITRLHLIIFKIIHKGVVLVRLSGSPSSVLPA